MTGSSRFRPLAPREPGGDEQEPPEGEPPVKRTRRGVVAACSACRRSKTRCDGRRPVCSACQHSRLPCEYDVPAGVTPPDAAKQKSEDLARDNESLRGAFRFIRQGDPRESEEVLKRVRESKTLEEALLTVTNADLLLPSRESSAAQEIGVPGSGMRGGFILRFILPVSHLQSLSGSSSGDVSVDSSQIGFPQGKRTFLERAQLVGSPAVMADAPSPFSPGARGLPSRYDRPDYLFENTFGRRPGAPPEALSYVVVRLPAQTFPLSRWTTVSDDDTFLTHLLTLFWTWDHTLSRLLDRAVFLEELRKESAPERSEF